MFETVKQNGRINGMVYLTSLLVSLIAHGVIICMLVVVPLIFFNMLQAEELLTFLIEPPPPPVPPPPPSPPAKAVAAHRSLTTNVEYELPRQIPKGIPLANDADIAPPNIAVMLPGVLNPGGQPVGVGTSIEGLLAKELIKVAPPRPPERLHPPIRVGMLEPSKLIYKVNPVYPPLAAKAHVSGTVVLEAVLNEEGSVSTIKVLSGHVFLVDAAVQAVKQWKYSPTIMNGEPVPIIATVTVIFRLD
jgi:periplasmic protein TonB